jgi:dynein heavy chain
VQKINIAAKSICEWVRAVSEFTDVFKETEKKRTFVEDMNKELDAANQILFKKQSELSTIISKVNLLEQQYIDNKKEKDRLDEEIKKTEARLSRAEELTKGLEDEQVRWRENVKGFSEDLAVLVGNAFLAGASVAYYGAFTGQFRY